MGGQEIAQSIGWLGETWGFWVQTGALLVSAIGAIAVIYYNGKLARLRALIDLLVHQKSDKDLVEATRCVNALHADGKRFIHHMKPECPERPHILMVLNNQEFIAVGVRLGAFDENTYKQLQCTNVLRLWEASESFITEIRRERGKETLFQDFEILAKRWKTDPIKRLK